MVSPLWVPEKAARSTRGCDAEQNDKSCGLGWCTGGAAISQQAAVKRLVTFRQRLVHDFCQTA
jgi:hypothetical protein